MQVQAAALQAALHLLACVPSERLPVHALLDAALHALGTWADTGCPADHARYPSWTQHLVALLHVLSVAAAERSSAPGLCMAASKICQVSVLIPVADTMATLFTYVGAWSNRQRTQVLFHMMTLVINAKEAHLLPQVLPGIILRCPSGGPLRRQLCEVLVSTASTAPEHAHSMMPLLALLRLDDEVAPVVAEGLRGMCAACPAAELDSALERALAPEAQVSDQHHHDSLRSSVLHARMPVHV